MAKFKSILISTTIVILLSLVFILYYALLKVDVATQPIKPALVPELLDSTHKPRPLVVLVSYADGPEVFFKNQNALTWSAINRGIDVVLNYRRGQIDSQFYEKNKEILTQKVGAGFWLWKPYFILKAMETFPDDTVILYADSGVVFTDSLEKVLDVIINQNKILLVGHGKPVPLRTYLKEEARRIFGVEANEKILNSQNIWGFFMGMRNTPENRELVRKWLAMCENKDALTNDPMDPKIQEKGFEFHEWDQSLLSILVGFEPEGKVIIRRDVLRKEYGVSNFHRHKEEEDTSPLFYIAGIHRTMANALFNNPLIRWIRRI